MTRIALERRALQLVGAAACLVPIITGAEGIIRGAHFLKGVPIPPPHDLDSHFRYLSGIFFGVGLAFASTIPAIERKTQLFRLLAAFVVCGGLARALSWATVGAPGPGHQFGLAMELGVVPLLTLWQGSLARRWPRR